MPINAIEMLAEVSNTDVGYILCEHDDDYGDDLKEMVKMYQDMDDADRRAIYHVMRKVWAASLR